MSRHIAGWRWRGGIVPCGRTDYLPFFADWYSTDYWISRQVLSICGSDSWSVYLLAIVGILNSVVSLYYYVKPIRMMFFEQPRGDEGTVRSRP